MLFFGCRNRDKDFIYEDELLAYTRSGALTSLETAFSRDQDRKVYVQDLLREQQDQMRSLLASGAHFYVCGGTAMGSIPIMSTKLFRVSSNLKGDIAQG